LIFWFSKKNQFPDGRVGFWVFVKKYSKIPTQNFFTVRKKNAFGDLEITKGKVVFLEFLDLLN
jgi:hypothetical protein